MERDGSGIEIEIKLRAASVDEAIGRLARLPAGLEQDRRFEDNDVFDTPDGSLKKSHHLLRLRVVEAASGEGIVTFKENVETTARAKVRAEIQSRVHDAVALRDIFGKLGLLRVYRYQKYRSYYGWTDPATGARLSISLDDTPIGVFLELEGDQRAIDHAASRMGYQDGDYILEDYRSLHRAWLVQRGLPPGDMVFP